MKAVVDTNVVAYYLLGTEPFVEEVRQFWRTVEEPCAPTHWEAELANAVWMAVRMGVLPTEEGHQKLDLAARLGIESVANRSLWQPALTRALSSGAAVYDLCRRYRLRSNTDAHYLGSSFRPASRLSKFRMVLNTMK